MVARLRHKSHQVLDEFLQLFLGALHVLLLAHDGDDLAVLVTLAGEHDSGAGAGAQRLDLGAVLTCRAQTGRQLAATLSDSCSAGGSNRLAG